MYVKRIANRLSQLHIYMNAQNHEIIYIKNNTVIPLLYNDQLLKTFVYPFPECAKMFIVLNFIIVILLGVMI